MDNDDFGDVSTMEINFSNTNSNSEIVINDHQLLELLYMHPFLICKAVYPYGDKDYEEWGWEEVTRNFNLGYEGFNLSVPFSVDDLQWRWVTLQQICPTLSKAYGQIPTVLWNTVCKIKRLLDINVPSRKKEPTTEQKGVLQHLPLVEQLTTAQQRQLEVEVINAILSAEKDICLGKQALGEEDKYIVDNEYDDFLKAVFIKEQASLSRYRSRCNSVLPKLDKSPLENFTNPCTASHKSNQVAKIKKTASNSVFKADPCDQPVEEVTDSPATEDGPRLRYVPLKSAKHYVKRVRVRVKRLNMKAYKPLPH